MGLTHSWRRPTELRAGAFAAAVEDVARVLAVIGVELAGFEGQGSPILQNDVIVFNGVGGFACEPFEIHQQEFDRRGRPETFSFCKTEGLPYDLAVKVALIVLRHHLGTSIEVSSDQCNETWHDARQLVFNVLGFGSDFETTPKV